MKKTRRRQSDNPPVPAGTVPPVRVPPAQALPDVVERVVLRKQVMVVVGDVVITRERVPRLNPYATAATPWRYCVRVYPDPQGDVYTAFPNAASAAEQLAAHRNARVLYVEDNIPTLLADYRRG